MKRARHRNRQCACAGSPKTLGPRQLEPRATPPAAGPPQPFAWWLARVPQGRRLGALVQPWCGSPPARQLVSVCAPAARGSISTQCGHPYCRPAAARRLLARARLASAHACPRADPARRAPYLNTSNGARRPGASPTSCACCRLRELCFVISIGAKPVGLAGPDEPHATPGARCNQIRAPLIDELSFA